MLTQEISNADDTLSLDNNYTHVSGENKVCISKSMFIEGNGYSINSNDSGIFNISNDTSFDIVFNNIAFNFHDDLLADFNNTSNITFICCNFNFENNNSISLTLKDDNQTLNYSCEVTQEIRDLAFSIIGKSSGITAAKKLAKWVHTNILGESKAGFYQSPTETLYRKKGNCCCRTELFFQLCESIGLTEDHDFYFVHVGTMQFKHRHFFAIVDDVCVDVTSGKWWGRGGFGNRTILTITKYPILPIPRDYL